MWDGLSRSGGPIVRQAGGTNAWHGRCRVLADGLQDEQLMKGQKR